MQNTMGTVIGEYPVKFAHNLTQYLFVIILIGVSIAGFYSVNTYMTPEIMADMPVYFQFLPFLPAVMALGLLIKTVLEQSKRIVLYSDGIGDGKTTWSWQDVMYFQGGRTQHYYLFIPVGKTYYFRLVFKDGKGLTLDGKFANIKDLFERVEDETAKLDIKMPY